jgi:phage tail sheath protein FI
MPSYVSPGVYSFEKDLSQFAPSINSSVVGLVGFASKGPINKATLITSPQQLVDTFGKPDENIEGQGLEGAVEILETTNALYFVRASVASTALEASAFIPLGACPAVAVLGSDDHFGELTGHSGYGVSADVYLKLNGYDNAGNKLFTSDKSYAVTTSLTTGVADSIKETEGELIAFKKALGGELDSGKIGAYFEPNYKRSPFIVAPYAGSAAYLDVTAYSDSAYSTPVSALKPVIGLSGTVSGSTGIVEDGMWCSSVRSHGVTFESVASEHAAAGNYLVESLYPGTGYNLGTKSDGTTSGNSAEVAQFGSQNWKFTVNDDGVQSETFKMSFVNSGSFVTDILNTADLGSNNKSDTVIGNFVSGDGNTKITVTKLDDFSDQLVSIGYTIDGLQGTWGGATSNLVPGSDLSGGTLPASSSPTSVARFIKPVQGTVSLVNGTNGTGTSTENATALIGDATVDPKTGMQALDDDTINISLAAVPGVTTESVQNALITLAETGQNFLSVVSPPYGVGTVQDAIEWSNGQSAYRTSPINNSYTCTFWPWVKVFSQFDNKDVWYDPAIFAIRQMTFTDSVSDPWFAPAGYTRGKLTKPVDLEVSLTQGDRDTMYSGGNVVNPIQKWPQDGIMIWGQRTMKRTPSALDRINVRRLMIYIRKLILASTREFVFEPNDVFTWDRIKAVLNPAMLDIQNRRGIVEYEVICDDTTNTPLRVDRNELWTKVLVKPTKTAEMLIFEINLTSQGAELTS